MTGLGILLLFVSFSTAALVLGLRQVGRIERLRLSLTLSAALATAILAGSYVEMRWGIAEKLRDRSLASDIQIIARRDEETARALHLDIDTPGADVPPPRSTNNPMEIAEWREKLRQRLSEDVFRIDLSRPENREVDVRKISSEMLNSGVTRTLVEFQAEDKAWIPGYLFQPRGVGPFPLVLVVPGHVREGQSGIAQTAGLVDSYQHGAALMLAQAGFMTFTLELRGFGALGQPYNTEHVLVAYNAIRAGTFYKAIIVKDISRSLDWLLKLPLVDADRVAIAGASLGGELAVTYAALDERIGAIVVQAFGEATGVVVGRQGSATDQPHYCHLVPGVRGLLRHEEWFYLLAPRPTLVVRGTFDKEKNSSLMDLLRAEWAAVGAEGNLISQSVTGGHEFFVAPAVDFLRKYL